jgi:putative redox protein
MSEPTKSAGQPEAPTRPSAGTPTVRSHATWRGGLLFDAGVGERTQQIDGNSKVAPSPVETLLSSVGTCAGADVVDILTKQRTPPGKLEIEVFATRRTEHPRRILTLELTFTVDGAKLERPQVERAIALSIEKYCTVAATLAGDIELDTVLQLNGARGQPVRQPMFSAKFPRSR